MRPWLLVVAAAGCSDQASLHPAGCGSQCWATVHRTGECRPGVWSCSTTPAHCAGGRGPAPEICDGLDDDCNGIIDDHPIGEGRMCGSGVGTCERGTLACIDGEWSCEGSRDPAPEICDGLDDDCNGIIDDLTLVSFCYTGPSDTVLRGSCHPGVIRCASGAHVCALESTPSPEICDGLDDDCDGIIDEGTDPGQVDLMILLDSSPSMGAHIPALSRLLASLSEPHPTRRVGVVLVPGHVGVPALARPLAGTSSATAPLIESWTMTQQSIEPTYDAVEDLASGAIAPGWGAGTRHALVVTDEAAQSRRRLTEDAVRAAATAARILVTIATPAEHSAEWDDVGLVHELADTAAILQAANRCATQ